MLNNEHKPLIALAEDKEIIIEPGLINRHGLIAGATGTGKTISLQTLAETFSSLGIPVFMADVKGDLSGIARAGSPDSKLAQRAKELDLEAKGYRLQAFPVCFWDVFGKNGHPLRATISDLGPVLLSRLLNLNDVQSGVMSIIFRIADDQGLLLLDLKDLRSMTSHVGEERDQYRAQYGQISPASIGAIQRGLLRLEEEGGENFFGEPALDIMDLLQTDRGLGVINILDGTRLINSPALYACVLLWLLSELFERLPECGDLAKPKLAFFFDEAHLLFNDISPVLLQKIEQMAKLIRSRGVGIYFASQSPSDLPDSVLGQLGNRIQHALRAFTPKERKAIKAAADAFRPNPKFSTSEALETLGVGEALVSFLDAKGAPGIVEKAAIVPPQSQAGPITPQERKNLMAKSLVAGIYDKSIDRESAYEILADRAMKLQAQKDLAERQKAEEKAYKAQARQQARTPRKPRADDNILGYLAKETAKKASNTVGREIGKAVIRGLLGSILGSKR